MAAILGVIPKLPPIKRAMASEQVKSRYLDRLIRKYDGNGVERLDRPAPEESIGHDPGGHGRH
jgi:hypothetical protein